MTVAREPFVFEVELLSLRPTQFAVGEAEVKEKRAEWQRMSERERSEFLARMVIPVVVGPGGDNYLIDHHHEGRALLGSRRTVLAHAQADLSRLRRREFWSYMVMTGWCHLFDENGRPRPHDELPASLAEMRDDPYRALAGRLRKAGGYAKSDAPFAEFKWANHLRSRVDDPADLRAAMRIAASREASFLPGWVSGR